MVNTQQSQPDGAEGHLAPCLRIGPVTFRVAKGCDRCVFTTIDPDTAAKGHGSPSARARHRRWEGKVWFGINLTPTNPGPGALLRPGDPIEILD